MKRSIFFILFVCCNVYLEARKLAFNAPDLGKTHFIVGLPPQSIAKQQSSFVCKTDLSGKLQCQDGSFKQAFFSPDDDLQQLLIQLINAERSSIKLAIFSFTDSAIAQALIEARDRGVEIEIVTDITSIRDKFNKIDYLKKHGIRIYIYNPRTVTILNNIMHHKFVLFGKNVGGKSLLWTGSFNFTKSAKINNQENVVVLDEIHLINRFDTQFGLLKERVNKKSSMKIAQRKRKHVTA